MEEHECSHPYEERYCPLLVLSRDNVIEEHLREERIEQSCKGCKHSHYESKGKGISHAPDIIPHVVQDAGLPSLRLEAFGR